jgi:hypothetical protein
MERKYINKTQDNKLKPFARRYSATPVVLLFADRREPS